MISMVLMMVLVGGPISSLVRSILVRDYYASLSGSGVDGGKRAEVYESQEYVNAFEHKVRGRIRH